MSGVALGELRARIDELDVAIVEALAERLALSRETVEHKHGASRDVEREADVLAHVTALASRCGLDPGHAVSLYELVLRISVQIQDETLKNHPV